MIIDIPKNNPYKASNDGEINGSISSTFCCDFEKKRGQLVPATRIVATDTTADTPVAFAGPFSSLVGGVSTDRYWSVVGTQVQQNTTPFGSWNDDSASGGPTDLDPDIADLIQFNGGIWVVGDRISQDVYYRGSTSWTTITTSTGLNSMSLVDYADRLYIAGASDGSYIYSVSTPFSSVTTSGSYTFDLGNVTTGTQQITCARAVSDGIWFGTVNTASGRAAMYKWDGVTANTADAVYKIDAKAVLSIVIKDDRPYIVDSKGVLSTFNGSYFQEIAELPMDDDRLVNFDTDDADRFIHKNGMAVIDEQIHILVNNRPHDANSKYPQRLQAGVYVYDEHVGLYHKHGLCQTTDETVIDHAVAEVSEVGAIYPAIQGIRDNYGTYTKFLCGATYYTDATTAQAGVFTHVENDNNLYIGPLAKSCYFTTTKIQAEQVQESWQEAVAIYETMENSTDTISIKYRTNTTAPTRATVTWTSTTSFTSTTNLSSIVAGDEVFIKRGKGAGQIAHIDSISGAGGTYTVVVDTVITGAAGTGIVNIQPWKLIGNVSDTDGDFSRHSVGADSTWIQYKIFMSGTGDNPVLNRFISISAPKATFN